LVGDYYGQKKFSIDYLLTQGNVSFAQDTNEKDKNAVIYVFLGGGATHIETFNPIPLAPSNYRSVTGTARLLVWNLAVYLRNLRKREIKLLSRGLSIIGMLIMLVLLIG
jgi:hypothetical protein